MAHVPLIEEPKLVNGEDGPVWERKDGCREFGPPFMDIIWNNMWHSDKEERRPFTMMRKPMNTSLDKMLRYIANDVEDGLYTIVSMNASKYQMTVNVYSTATTDDVMASWHKRHTEK